MKLSRKAIVAVQMISVVLLAAIDQLIKYAVLENLKPLGSVKVIDGFLAWTYAENTGAAFSIFTGNTVFLSVFTAVAILAGCGYLVFSKKHHVIYDICIPLLIAGGLGNLIDRIALGFVVDYIQVLFVDFPIFNFADCLVTCSDIALIVYLIYDLIADMRREKTAKAAGKEE